MENVLTKCSFRFNDRFCERVRLYEIMTTPEGLAFLRAHQPMPDDEVLNLQPELMLAYDEVRRHFVEHPDPGCVPLLLNSFGGWNGFGMYQMVEEVFYQLDEQLVTEALLRNLRDVARLGTCTLYWNVQLCIIFPHPGMLTVLAQVLNHPLADLRITAAYALSQLEPATVATLLQQQLAVEDDPDVVATLSEVLEEL
ncbi:HEAT repeat domain-containing protein [Hymenobacter metallicola]|uniref:HEAT repeat domain-containing protein n=1 Tax=Hymenobacter metallicola TaxID=2563114 RepID=A0A4Z0Q0U3_9BACT|nr:HEAT repeat domain-containing protein [Hymenobacter metallicola]